MTRRALLGACGFAALSCHLPWRSVFGRRAAAAGPAGLVPDPDGILDLPPGFTYRILETGGDPMDDGYRAFIDSILQTARTARFQPPIGRGEERLRGFHGG